MFGRVLRFLFALPVALLVTAGLYYFGLIRIIDSRPGIAEAPTQTSRVFYFPRILCECGLRFRAHKELEPVNTSTSYTRRDKAISQPPRPSECADNCEVSKIDIPGDVLRISDAGIPNAFRLREIKPTYPKPCLDKGVSAGRVIVEYDISPEGAASNARIIESTDQCFDAAALKNISKFRYPPATDETGRAVWRRGERQTFIFELEP